MIAAFGPEDNRLRAGVTGGHIRVATRQARPFVPAEAFETALSLHGQGRLREAERLYRALLKAAPEHAGALHHLGVVKAQQGNLNEAIRLIRRALEQEPRSAEAHNDLGVALESAKRYAEAVPYYERALALKLDYGEAYFNLGNALQALERHEEAIAHFAEATTRRRDPAEAHNNLGMSLSALGRHEEAIAQFKRALALRPDYTDAEHNLGSALHGLGRYGEALAHSRRALALKPGHAKAQNSAGSSLRQLNRPLEAIREFEQAIALEPRYAEAHYNLGSLLKDLGKREEAIARYETALRLKRDLTVARFALSMAQLPIVYRDEAEIAEGRRAYEQQLRRLSDDVESGNAPGDLAEGLGSNLPFYLAYQGLNDRELQSIHGTLACRIMAERYPPVALAPPPSTSEHIRVGIISGFFSRHTVWRLFIRGWLSRLDRRRFSVFGYHTSATQDGETRLAADLCDHFVSGPMSVQRWREAITTDQLQVLIYPEIGMDGVSAQLAAQRLASTQCVAWGHPETTGMPTIDYFLSSDLMEPPDGQTHYTERLIRLPNLSIYYEPPEVKAISMGRAELGLRDGAIAYWCGQSLYKYLPRYDEVYPRIARELGNCQFVFIEHRTGSDMTELFRGRLERAFAGFGLKAANHCVFLRRLDQDRFIAAVGQCDIYLDSIGWSGGNTTLESLEHDVPIVTFKGPLMRGRHTAAILERMGIVDTTTETLDDYVSTAVRLAREPEWRNAIKRRIAEGKHRIYRDRSCIEALEDFLDRSVRSGDAPRSVEL